MLRMCEAVFPLPLYAVIGWIATIWKRVSIFSIVTRLRAGWSGIRLPEAEIFFSSPQLQITSEIHPVPVQRILGFHSLGRKRPGLEVNQSPPSNAKIRMRGPALPLPAYTVTEWRGQLLMSQTELPSWQPQWETNYLGRQLACTGACGATVIRSSALTC
jgi:hypothetical protein